MALKYTFFLRLNQKLSCFALNPCLLTLFGALATLVFLVNFLLATSKKKSTKSFVMVKFSLCSLTLFVLEFSYLLSWIFEILCWYPAVAELKLFLFRHVGPVYCYYQLWTGFLLAKLDPSGLTLAITKLGFVLF